MTKSELFPDGCSWCFALVKPGFTDELTVAKVVTFFEAAGLRVHRFSRRSIKPTPDQIAGLIGHLKQRNPDAYRRNFAYYKGGEFVPLVLIDNQNAAGDANSAIEKARAAAGKTNPPDAAPGTIRRELSSDSLALCTAEKRGLRNVVHVSDSPDAVLREAALFSLWSLDGIGIQSDQPASQRVILHTGDVVMCSHVLSSDSPTGGQTLFHHCDDQLVHLGPVTKLPVRFDVLEAIAAQVG